MTRRSWYAVIAMAFIAGVLTGRAATEAQAPEPSARPDERVTGIGGVFFKAKNPALLAQWYRDNLGVDVRGTRSIFEWRERDEPTANGLTVWAIFPDSTKYFSPGTASFMVNYRVRNLDRMVTQLRGRGVAVDERITQEEAGRFTWLVDPEGNRIELWEPRR